MAGKVLSIAVPSYNVERYLADSLASYCADGADERLEVIVVDDGSTDLTPYIAREFMALHPTVFRLVSKENGGHGSAVNAGLEAATGTYFRIIDGDDRICTANIPRLLDELEAAKDDLVVDIRRDVVMGTGRSTLFVLPDDLPRNASLPFESVCLRPDIEQFFMIHTISARTDFLRESGVKLLEHTFYVDIEFIVKAASRARTIRFLELEACNYYVGNAEQSVAPANYVKRWADHTRVTNEMLRFADAGGLEPQWQQFVDERVRLLANTHYNIALIFDEDRPRGAARAREFRFYLKKHHPRFAAATDRRYYQALALHYAGINADRLNKLMRR